MNKDVSTQRKKYELTDETKQVLGKTLHRIRALIDFDLVKKGALGGWIEKEENLSHDGNGWVSGDALVFDCAQVFGNALVSGNAKVYGCAKICGSATITRNAHVYDSTWVYGEASVHGDAQVYGNAVIHDNAEVFGNARVYGNAEVFGNAWIYGSAWVFGYAQVNDKAKVSDYARISDRDSVFWIPNIGPRDKTMTFALCADGKIRVACGYFYGDLDDFLSAVQGPHGDNEHTQVYRMAVEMAKVRLGGKACA